MKIMNTKRGSAIALCLVFASVLLLMGLGFAKQTGNSKVQTVKIDERIKLDYLAQGMTELALLKFQLYPADFYACMDAYNAGYTKPLIDFGVGAKEFKVDGDKNSISSFNEVGVTLHLASMTIYTDQKWKNEVLYLSSNATYEDQFKHFINKTVTRLIELERRSQKPN